MADLNLLETVNNATSAVYYPVKSADLRVNPFTVYKSWTFTSASIDTHTPLLAIYDSNIWSYNNNTTFNNSALNNNGSYQVSIYHSINHMFYNFKNNPYNLFGQNDINKTKRHLFETASVFSIPQSKIGENIKYGSFNLSTNINDVIKNTSIPVTKSLNIQSDRYGNLLQTDYDTGSIIPNVMYYEGFNEYFDTTNWPYTQQIVNIIPGIPTIDGAQQPIGKAGKFDGTSYIQSQINGNYDRDNDYAVSFFISASNTGSNNQIVISKSDYTGSTQWPFSIELSGSNQIVASTKGSDSINSYLTSSLTVTDWTHVVYQKTGSNLELYINGTLHNSASNSWLLPNVNSTYTSSTYINNLDPVYIGGFGANTLNLTGVLDEIRIFNHALTTSSISALNDRSEASLRCIQTNHVGNVFEKHGIVAISSLDYTYEYILNSNYTASYKSTLTMYELNALVRVNKGTLNISSNPTTLKDNFENIAPTFLTDEFSPYITTIGLYNSRNELLAIGKLAQPIQKRDDIDVNFLIRIDLDKNLPITP